jgi:hypothetical protein
MVLSGVFSAALSGSDRSSACVCTGDATGYNGNGAPTTNGQETVWPNRLFHANPPATCNIGCHNSGRSFFDGLIDEVRIFSGALEPHAILQVACHSVTVLSSVLSTYVSVLSTYLSVLSTYLSIRKCLIHRPSPGLRARVVLRVDKWRLHLGWAARILRLQRGRG